MSEEEGGLGQILQERAPLRRGSSRDGGTLPPLSRSHAGQGLYDKEQYTKMQTEMGSIPKRETIESHSTNWSFEEEAGIVTTSSGVTLREKPVRLFSKSEATQVFSNELLEAHLYLCLETNLPHQHPKTMWKHTKPLLRCVSSD